MNHASDESRRFEGFELDVASMTLRRDGNPVKIHAQPLRLLLLLTGRPGEIVTRDEIREGIWDPDTHVDFDQGINACVRQVRTALDDSADNPRYLETLPKQGYRFTAGVSRTTPAATRTRDRRQARRGRIAAAALITMAALSVSYPLLSTVRGTARDPVVRPVLAILPFESLGEGGRDAFGDALTEELIAGLGRSYASRIAVIARTSAMQYKGTRQDIQSIAAELGADFLLEGSVRNHDGRLRVTAQLIDGRDASHLWASNYDRDFSNLVDVQVELGDTIGTALGLHLLPPSGSRPAAAPVRDWAEYQAAVTELRLGGAESLRRAQQQLEALLARNPTFARAYVELSDTYRFLDPTRAGAERARQALEKALALDDALPQAHLGLATLRFYRDYDLEGARRSFQRAIEINPNYAEAHHALAAYYSVTRRHDDAIASVQQARRLDPRSSMVGSDVGWYYYFARRYEEAITHSQRTLQLDPKFYWAHLCVLVAGVKQGDLEGARRQALRYMQDRQAPPEDLDIVRGAAPDVALATHWRWRLRRLESFADRQFVSPSDFSQIHIALGDRESALASLEAGFEHRSGWILPFLTVDPLFDPLREDPRFQDLLARITAATRTAELHASRR